MYYILLIIGFVLLIKGADILVDGSSSIAKKYGISPLVIGLTIIAFGTSAPEFVVSFLASINGQTDLAIANVLGSNISNMAFIIGLTAIIYPLKTPLSTFKKELPFSIIVSIVLLLLVSDTFLGFGKQNILGFWDGIILLIFFLGFLIYTYKISKHNIDEKSEIKDLSLSKSVIFIVFGLIGLLYGGNLIVENAVKIAQNFGLSNAFIGVTIVALGTSLPELASSMMSAIKKNTSMAMGCVIGSNIFNMLWILGFSATFKGLNTYNGIFIDLSVCIGVGLLLFILNMIGSKYIIGRWKGIILLLAYFLYVGYLIYKL